ncbi:Biotin-lipoyl like [Poseidonocella pacifica]|uniref:Biotin-lipoyl like n=1 Tax=Poseidonocella pacifica TaxID=871651 RepID=A0A1I0XIF7_9RHOB|nr:HlyD family efflux transporter periplasmic adaptor subunit [Poseidonocella pacifica]SFB00008.1 Biotin-lipoyl like [Poseidonocella pacifica]
MRFLRQSLTGLVLLGITLALLAWAGMLIGGAVEERLAQEPRAPRSQERVFAVNAVVLEPGTVTPELTTYGEVRSRRTLDVRPAVGGTVVELGASFEEGGAISAGDLLLRVDPKDAEDELARAEADLQDATQEVRDADRALSLAEDKLIAAEEQAVLREKALTRQRDLQDRGVGSASAVEDAELSVSTARQAVLSAREARNQAEARIEQGATALSRAQIARDEAQRRLEDTTLRAQFDGTLTEVTVVEGGIVSANEQLARLVDPDRLEVAVRLSTAQYSRLLDQEGRLRQVPATVTLDVYGLGLTSSGTVSRDSASVTSGESGRIVYVQLDEPRGLKPGDFVSVGLEEPPLDRVARVPSGAVDAAGTVLVIGAEDRLEVADVEVLRRQGDDVLIRARGLGGAQIVAERTPLLGAGIKVRVIGAPEPPEEEAVELLELSEDRRARLVAFIESNSRMPEDAKARVLAQLREPRVPAQVVSRIEDRMGG